MFKNLIIIVLVIVALVEGGLLLKGGLSPKAMSSAPAPSTQPQATDRPRPPAPLTKGMKLSDSPLAQYAFQIAPGELSAAAKQALHGFDIKTKTLADGSIQVNVTPNESDDQSQQYTVKKGNILYFIEMTPVDDSKDNVDTNLRDDYGIITDANGIVQ